MNAETQPVSTESVNDRDYHNGDVSFRSAGRKWHFTAPAPNGKPFTAIIQLRGGFEVANRVAVLVGKDIARSGRIGANRANIDRLIDAARTN